jgi:putative MFS transporter
VLGIIGIAVSMAAGPLHLDALWMGLLGAASLAGLFFGSMLAGPIADKYGRRTIFAYDMLLFAVVSAAQYFVTSPSQLLVLRLVLGLILGADYVVSKSLVTEYSPRRYRGRLLSVLAAAWAAGYVGAYLAGFAMRDIGPDAWRIMLAASGVPALLILPFRLIVPESPMWLMKRGRGDEALAIIRRRFGPEVTLATATAASQQQQGAWSQLFSPRWRKNTLVGCVFYTCQVIPYFALGTFAPKVLEALHVKDKFVGGLVYNILLLAGAVIGLLLIDRICRRTFLLGTFYLAALGLAVLTYASFGPSVRCSSSASSRASSRQQRTSNLSIRPSSSRRTFVRQALVWRSLRAALVQPSARSCCRSLFSRSAFTQRWVSASRYCSSVASSATSWHPKRAARTFPT